MTVPAALSQTNVQGYARYQDHRGRFLVPRVRSSRMHAGSRMAAVSAVLMCLVELSEPPDEDVRLAHSAWPSEPEVGRKV